jgi:hypothetical protein
MKHNITNLRFFALALLVALFTFASIPQESMAQRTRTSKGKVTVQRDKKTSKPRSASKAVRSKVKVEKREGSKETGSQSRSSDAARSSTGNRSSSSDARNAQAKRTDRNTNAAGNRNSNASRSNDNRTVGNRSNGNVGRGDVVGNRSTLKNGGKSQVVVNNKRRNSVRFAPRIFVPSKFNRNYRPSTRISIHIAWPWMVRYERRWSPRYRYRQVVYVESNWSGQKRSSRVEMETVYRHKVKYANNEYAVLEIDIEEVALYDSGRYLGTVDRIPSSLSKIEATVYRDGRIDFDRDVFVVGDSRAGFEMISTRFYDDYAMAGYRDSDGYEAGKLNLRSGKVSRIRRSRLFDPRNFNGFAPISLLPEEEGWLWDYGVDAISAESDDYDSYYGYNGGAARGLMSNSPLSRDSNYSYDTDFGASFKVDRKSNIQRVE